MKRLLFYISLILLFSTSLSYGQEKDGEYTISGNLVSNASLSDLMIACYVCHNPHIKSHEDIMAPPLVAVKYLYKMKYPESKDFADKMTEFILHPDNQKAIMQGPVMKFGVMPEMFLDSIQVRRITEYVYHNEIEEPIWFSEHFENRHGIKWKKQ